MTAKAEIKVPESPYVYALIDPRDGVTFYIGKGRGSRMFAHVTEAKRNKPGGKSDRIREILACGLNVDYAVLGEYPTDAEAYVAEKSFISSMGGLTNKNSGGAGSFSGDKRVVIMARASALLRELAPFEVWSAGLRAEFALAIISVCGSLESFYELIKSQLIRNSVDPEPNTICIGPDGAAKFGWE